jgi:hypothetical protein
VTTQAIAIMAASGMHLSPEEVASARQIIPKVSFILFTLIEVAYSCNEISGLARHVKDSPVFTTAFEELVDKDPELEGDAKALPTRCATRWNTDRICIAGHLHFKTPVQWLTSNPRFKLKKYALTNQQWALASKLSKVLEVYTFFPLLIPAYSIFYRSSKNPLTAFRSQKSHSFTKHYPRS